MERLEIDNRRLREGVAMTELTQECEQLKWVTHALEDKLKKKRMKKRGWLQAIERAQEDSREMKKVADGWKVEAITKGNEASKLRDAKEDANKRLIDARVQYAEIQYKRNELKSERDELKRMRDQLKNERDELKNENNQLKNERDELKNKEEGMKKAEEEQSRIQRFLVKRNEDLERQVRELTEKLNQ